MEPITDHITTLRGLILHLDWARDMLMERALPLGDDQLDQPFEMGMGSLRATLRHLWDADQAWLDIWRLGRDAPRPDAPDGLSVAALHDLFRAVERERCAYFDEVGAAAEATPIDLVMRGTEYSIPLGDLMLHVANHGAHHRAQASNMLRRLGIDPPGLDYLRYCLTSEPRPGLAYDVATIQEYQRYGDWANERVRPLVREIDEATLDRPVPMGLGSMRKTILHIEGAERWWLDTWYGDETRPFHTLPDDTPLTTIEERFAETIVRRDAFIAECADDELTREVAATTRNGHTLRFLIGDTMLQLGQHGSYHRAQLANMLRHAGHDAPGLDYFTWCAQGSPYA